MELWDAGIPISGAGITDTIGTLARVELDTIPGWLGASSDTPARYVKLGTAGFSASDYRDAGQRLLYASQHLAAPQIDLDAVYWVLVPGVEGTLYRGREVGTVDAAVGCVVGRTADQLVANASVTALSFDTDQYDPFGMHDESVPEYRIYASVAGLYLFVAQVVFDVSAAGVRYIRLVRNGSASFAFGQDPAPDGSNYRPVLAAGMVVMAAGDEVRLLVYQSSGGSLNVKALDYYSPILTGVRLA